MRKCINKRFIGVPPKAPAEFRLPIHFPTAYNQEMFKCEDERYFIDLNIHRYKHVLKRLDEALKTEDEELREKKIARIRKSNVKYNFNEKFLISDQKMVNHKYETEETTDELEKLKSIIADVSHDVISLLNFLISLFLILA